MNSGGNTSTPDPNSVVNYNIGVQGDSTSFALSVYRVQPGPVGAPTNVPDPVVVSDLRRVNYWLVMNGPDTLGLARQEIQQATSLDIDPLPGQVSDPNSFIVAKEVKNILFEYFDGSSWQTSWDGTTVSGDSGTPIGPPVAIRVTLTIRRGAQLTNSDTSPADGSLDLQFVQIIQIAGANNPVPVTITPNQ
jgi:hypothetical protein